MKAKVITVSEQGDILIPKAITIALHLKPKENIIIREDYGYLIIEKPKKMCGEKIEKLLKKGLKNVEWEDIEKEREDEDRKIAESN